MRKILLNKCRSKTSVNETNVIPIEINRDASLFQDEHYITTVDTMQVYNDEKDTSKNHRIICTIKPLCSNVLFNNITEVVYKEGTTSCKNLTVTNAMNISGTISSAQVNSVQAIRNTEYSHPKHSITYHCGADIFNNHILRSKYSTIIERRWTGANKNATLYYGQMSAASSSNNTSNIGDWDYESTIFTTKGSFDAFNTIGDYLRNSKGNNIPSRFPNSSDGNYIYGRTSSYTANTPVYTFDTIKSFQDSYKDNLKRHDGWLGFNNRTIFSVPVSGTSTNGYFINKCINYKESCEFIDMYPERDLFSFTPYKNDSRNRLEYNWDYCITYPAECNYNDTLILNGKGRGLPLATFTVLGVNEPLIYKEYLNSNGTSMLIFRSIVKHNLKAGDNIYIILKDGEKLKAEVVKLGDSRGKNKERHFVVRKDDFDSNIMTDSNPPERFIKLSGGFECDYYYRVLRKINAGDIKSTINNLSFARTAYGDDVSQIVFTDDINTSDYVDNLGRPLTELYLTIIKANRGYKEWYDKQNYIHANVERSHAFGKVTSGLDLPTYIDKLYPTVRYQHNINVVAESIKDKVNIYPSSSKLEKDITINQSSFLGDLVEFDPMSLKETTLEVVKHRFNTAQRETLNSEYTKLYYDEIYADHTDGVNYGKSNMDKNTQIIQWKLNDGFANLAPEGYIYNPHHKIKIGEFSNIIKQSSDTLINVVEYEFNALNGIVFVDFKTELNYGFLKGDVIGVLEYGKNILHKFRIVSETLLEDKKRQYIATAMTDTVTESIVTDEIDFFKHDLNTPLYAYMLPDKTGRHIWREVVKPSEITFNSDLYNIPFTNNAFYHHINVDFPVRRQDPFGEYNMSVYDTLGRKINVNFEIAATKYDITYDEYDNEVGGASCF